MCAAASGAHGAARKRRRTLPFAGAQTARDYSRHWPPVHIDLAVDDLDTWVARAQAAGATCDDLSDHSWGRLALMADPFGHGFCLLEFRGRGYDAIAT